MSGQKPRDLIFEREVGGDGCELTVTCRPANGNAPAADRTTKRKASRKPKTEGQPDLTPEQKYICDHATD